MPYVNPDHRSKTTKINDTRTKLLELFGSYALCAADWEPSAEGDYDSLAEGINALLEEVIK